MKLLLASALGLLIFTPMSAFAETTTVVTINKQDISCYAAERAGNFFQDGIHKRCLEEGYERQADYKPFIDEDVANKAIADATKTIISYCNLVNESPKGLYISTSREKEMCANIGVFVREK